MMIRTPDQHQPSIPYILCCMNDAQGIATAWFDDRVLEAIDTDEKE